MKYKNILYFLITIIVLLGSCGQKGPLYLPETTNTTITVLNDRF